MTDEGEEPDKEVDFDEIIEALEEQQRERREQVSFEWVETVREAGELYRETGDIEAVSKELNRSDQTTREALTVYRLVFQDPPGNVASKASTPGRAYFSLEDSVERVIDGDEDEPLEELLREYVGVLYMTHDMDEVPVGDPPEASTPPSAVDFEKLADSISFPSESILAASQFADLHDSIVESQARAMASIAEPLVAQHARIADTLVAASVSPVVEQIQRQQSYVNAAVAGMFSDVAQEILIPESIVADLGSIQPSVSAAAVAGGYPPPQDTSVVDGASKTEVKFEPLEATATTVPETGPVDATVDATLPDSDTFSTELVVEVPAMVVEALLSTGQARVWFTNLPEDHQLTVVRLILVSVAVSITGNPFVAPIAIIPAPAVKRAIIVEDEDLE